MNNDDFEKKSPYCNTGVLDTSELPTNGVRALIDWVSVTFKDFSDFKRATEILNLDFNKFEISEGGLNGYKFSARYGEISIYWGTPDNAQNMGTHINLSGQACREYEREFNEKLNWSDFFALCLNFNHKFTRLDIAIDDFRGTFTVKQLKNKAKKGHMTVSKVKKARYFEEFEIDTGKTLGETLYIGKSNQIIRFYDKAGERLSKGHVLPDDIKTWVRTEIQLRDDLATDACRILAYDNFTLGAFVAGLLKNKIDFKIPNDNDSNKSRWKSCKWWLDFLGDVEPIKLTQIASDPTVPKIADWIDRQVNKSLSVLNLAFDDTPALYQYLIKKGNEKLTKRDFQIIEEFKNDTVLKDIYLDDMYTFLGFKDKKSTPK